MRVLLQVYVKGRHEAIGLYMKAFDAVMGYRETLPDGTLGHVELDVQGHAIAIGEARNGGTERIPGNTMQFCLQFGEGGEDRVGKAYEVLKEGATINVPLGPCMFSPCMADIVDRFGVRWCLFV